MPGYRIDFIDDSGHVIESRHMYCVDDAQVHRWASSWVGQYPSIDIWEGVRSVAHIKPGDRASC